MDGMDAVNCYRKAIQVMLNNIETQVCDMVMTS